MEFEIILSDKNKRYDKTIAIPHFESRIFLKQQKLTINCNLNKSKTE